MASKKGRQTWSPDKLGSEVEKIRTALREVPSEQQLEFVKAKIRTIPEEYRIAAEALLLLPTLPKDTPPPPGAFGFLREAIREVPAVKYALGVGGVLSVISIVAGFGVGYRVAVIGFPIALMFMILLLIFAKLANHSPELFITPFLVLTWFSVFAMVVTVTFIITSVFFKWPLDLHKWLAGRSCPRHQYA